jgi:hypothetical protein
VERVEEEWEGSQRRGRRKKFNAEFAETQSALRREEKRREEKRKAQRGIGGPPGGCACCFDGIVSWWLG